MDLSKLFLCQAQGWPRLQSLLKFLLLLNWRYQMSQSTQCLRSEVPLAMFLVLSIWPYCLTRVVIFEAFPQHLWTSLHSPTYLVTYHFSRNHNICFIDLMAGFHMVLVIHLTWAVSGAACLRLWGEVGDNWTTSRRVQGHRQGGRQCMCHTPTRAKAPNFKYILPIPIPLK